MTTKSKLKENNEPVSTQESATKDKAKPTVEFMPGWTKDEACYKKAVVRDVNTKKILESGWPRQKPTEQSAYENWKAAVTNPDTGEFYPQKNEEGVPIKGTGARYVVTVITRVRDITGKKEFLTTKGKLIGFDVAGMKKERHIKDPEKWRNTIFAYERTYNERTGAYTVQTTGISPDSHDVYDLDFTPDNALAKYEKVEVENVMFVLKDLKTGEAKEVKWSSVKDTLDLFCHKNWNFLWKAAYIPLPVRMEMRQEAVAQGLIHGVASDYGMQSSSTSAGVE